MGRGGCDNKTDNQKIVKLLLLQKGYGALNSTGAFFWPFVKKITVASISMKNYQVVPFLIIFHVGLTYQELFYYKIFFFLQF